MTRKNLTCPESFTGETIIWYTAKLACFLHSSMPSPPFTFHMNSAIPPYVAEED
jgi:hypothetical protein